MNRERLTILRDHLAGLPDERVDMRDWVRTSAGAVIAMTQRDLRSALEPDCGTAACIAGWTGYLFGDDCGPTSVSGFARFALGLRQDQANDLFRPTRFENGIYSRADAIAAIDSLLANPDDDALPVWPEKAEVAA